MKLVTNYCNQVNLAPRFWWNGVSLKQRTGFITSHWRTLANMKWLQFWATWMPKHFMRNKEWRKTKGQYFSKKFVLEIAFKNILQSTVFHASTKTITRSKNKHTILSIPELCFVVTLMKFLNKRRTVHEILVMLYQWVGGEKRTLNNFYDQYEWSFLAVSPWRTLCLREMCLLKLFCSLSRIYFK